MQRLDTTLPEVLISLEEGLRQTIEWYQTNANWTASVRGGEYRSYYDKYYVNRERYLAKAVGGI